MAKYGYAPQFELLDNNIAVVRNRVRVKIEEFVAPDDEENEKKYHGTGTSPARAATSRKTILLVSLMLSVAVFFSLAYARKMKRDGHASTIKASTATGGTTPNGKAAAPVEVKPLKGTSSELFSKAAAKSDEDEAATPAKDWSNCMSYLQKPQTRIFAEKRVEPLWLPSYNTALPKGYSDFLNALTGVPKAAKSYYRTSHSVKRCHYPNSNYNVDGVTCEIAHPMVPANHPSPIDLVDLFGKKVLLAIRNPLTAFPATHQYKAEAYHGQKGQVTKESWIAFRDQYVGTGGDTPLFDEWKTFILTWRNMEPYDLEEYVPFEYWAEAKTATALANRLARIFRREGFPVVYERSEDISCMWHHHIYHSIADENEQKKGWREPEYTQEQLEAMATGLETFKDEVLKIPVAEKLRADGHLIVILDAYAKEVRSKLQ